MEDPHATLDAAIARYNAAAARYNRTWSNANARAYQEASDALDRAAAAVGARLAYYQDGRARVPERAARLARRVVMKP